MKQKILQKIEELWGMYPTQRFFQLLFNYSILGTRTETAGQIQDPFYYDDKDFYNSLKEELGEPTEVWVTAKGEEIEFKDLTDNHLQNILIDGYRADDIVDEAKRRKFKIPQEASSEDYEKAMASEYITKAVSKERLLNLFLGGNNTIWVLANRAKNKNFYEKTKKSTTATKAKNRKGS